MSQKLTGTIKVIMDEAKISDSFKKRDFVVTDNSSMYPQHILFQLTQDRCSLIEGYNVGEMVDVSFNIRGREWTSPQNEVKYFVTLEAWRIERANTNGAPVASGQQQMTSPASQQPIAPSVPDDLTSESDDDGLPF